jgi:hypothetical protein
MALGKKGMDDLVKILFALFLALLLAGIAVELIGKYVYNAPNTVISSIIACNGPGGEAGECLGAHCDNRNGWTSVGQYTCKDGQECCLLTSPGDWFTPGSVILSYDGHDYKLKEGGTIPPTGGVISSAKTFSLSYVPHTAPGTKDTKCTLSAGGKEIYPGSSNVVCAESAGGPLQAVTLFSGTGQAFTKQINGQPKGEYKVTVTADGSPTLNFNANIKIG